jgi:pimeloyl-[acyl-carrier protein] methyl ester esterase
MRRLLLSDGRSLAWREAGEGPPLVLLHGWAMSAAVFTEALDHLSSRFRVLAPDLRGHGASEGGPGYGFADFAADLREWMDALDLRDAVMGGWSMGGQVLLELYPAVRRRVRRLMLIAATPRYASGGDWSKGLPEGQIRVMARDLKRNYLKAMGDFFALQFAGEEIDRLRHRRIIDFAVRQGRLPEPETALAALESLRQGDQRDSLGGIDCPALVLHGELDRVVPPAAGRYLAEHLPQAQLVLLSGVGHAPFLSRPREMFEQWRNFCE